MAEARGQRPIVSKQRVEQRQLTLAADEAAPRAFGQQVTDRGLLVHFQLTASSLQYCARAARAYASTIDRRSAWLPAWGDTRDGMWAGHLSGRPTLASRVGR